MIVAVASDSYTPVCDNCKEDNYILFRSWEAALEWMLEEGWSTRRVQGKWQHYCPKCAKELDIR